MKNSKIIQFPARAETGKPSSASRPSRPVIVMPMRTVEVKSPAVGLIDEAIELLAALGKLGSVALRRSAGMVRMERSSPDAASKTSR